VQNIKIKNMLLLFSFVFCLQAEDQNDDDMIESEVSAEFENPAESDSRRSNCCPPKCKEFCCICVSDSLKVKGSLRVDGPATFNGLLTVNGLVNNGSESIKGGLSVTKNLTVRGLILGADGLPYPFTGAGSTGATGAAGATGATGATGGALSFASFYQAGLQTIAINAPVSFSTDGPSSGADITRTGATTFNLVTPGIYEVNWQVTADEPGQLTLWVGGVRVPETNVARATGTSQLVGSMFIQTTLANQSLTVVNDASPAALTLSSQAGSGTQTQYATLTIKRIA
jgi:hypothetical protein